MNSWQIPDWLEIEVRKRDVRCVYCGVSMTNKVIPGQSRCLLATWEHIINDASTVTRENIALCCCSCNASKGARKLSDWIDSPYCERKGINQQSVAGIVKNALLKSSSTALPSSSPTY